MLQGGWERGGPRTAVTKSLAFKKESRQSPGDHKVASSSCHQLCSEIG